VPDPVYFDTSAAVCYGLALAGSPEERDAAGKKTVEKILGSDAKVAASPVTLSEYCSVMHTCLRKTEGWFQNFGEDEVNRAEGELMGLISKNRLRIRQIGPRAFEMGMSYVSAASRDHGRAFKAWDAMHLYEASRWARELGSQVVLATADADFGKFIELFPEFSAHIRVLDVVGDVEGDGS